MLTGSWEHLQQSSLLVSVFLVKIARLEKPVASFFFSFVRP